MQRWLVVGFLSVLVAGCQPIEEETTSLTEVEATGDVTPPTVEPRAVAASFSSIDEAIAALATATDAKDSAAQKAAYNWLAQQDGAAVPAVVAAVNNASSSMESRRMACRVLSQLGPTAAEPLVEISRSGESQLQLKAIEAMPAIEPQQKIVVDRLIALLDDTSDQVRRAAIRSLGQIGPAAVRAGDKLIALQNNVDLDEMTRDEAAMAIKRVNPRKTFND
jgi:HEAT repeat protein